VRRWRGIKHLASKQSGAACAGSESIGRQQHGEKAREISVSAENQSINISENKRAA